MALQDMLITLGIQVDDSQLKKADHSVQGLVGQVRQFASAAASAFAVQQIVSFVDAIARAGDEIGDTAERLGVTTSALQELGYAAQLSGASADAMNTSLQILGRNQGLALQGGAIAGQFRQLGVAFQTAQGQALPLEEVFQNVAERAARARSPSERMAIATRLLGRSAGALAPLLARGADGIRELRREFVANGGGFSDEGIASASEFNDEVDRASAQLTSLKSTILVNIMPAFRQLVAVWNGARRALIEMNERSNVLKIAFGVLATIAVGAGIRASLAWAPVILPFLALALAVAGLILVLDDLDQFVTGGNSFIGIMVDDLWGAGTAASSLTTLIDDLDYASNALSATITGFWDSFVEGANNVFAAITPVIDQLFGTNTAALTLSETLRGVWEVLQLVTGNGPSVAEIDAADRARDAARAAQQAGFAPKTREVVADSGAVRGRSAGGDSANVTANANININGATDSAATAREVARAQSGVNDRAMRRARQELTPRSAS